LLVQDDRRSVQEIAARFFATRPDAKAADVAKVATNN